MEMDTSASDEVADDLADDRQFMRKAEELFTMNGGNGGFCEFLGECSDTSLMTLFRKVRCSINDGRTFSHDATAEQRFLQAARILYNQLPVEFKVDFEQRCRRAAIKEHLQLKKQDGDELVPASPYCEFPFTDQETLDQRDRLYLLDENVITCPRCPPQSEQMTTLNQYMNHLISHEDPIVLYACHQCGGCFSNSQMLTAHCCSEKKGGEEAEETPYGQDEKFGSCVQLVVCVECGYAVPLLEQESQSCWRRLINFHMTHSCRNLVPIRVFSKHTLAPSVRLKMKVLPTVLQDRFLSCDCYELTADSSLSSLEKHMAENHPEESKKCEACDQIVHGMVQYRLHILSHLPSSIILANHLREVSRHLAQEKKMATEEESSETETMRKLPDDDCVAVYVGEDGGRALTAWLHEQDPSLGPEYTVSPYFWYKKEDGKADIVDNSEVAKDAGSPPRDDVAITAGLNALVKELLVESFFVPPVLLEPADTLGFFICERCSLITEGEATAVRHLYDCFNVDERKELDCYLEKGGMVQRLLAAGCLPTTRPLCPQVDCRETCCSIMGLRGHLATIHGIQTTVEAVVANESSSSSRSRKTSLETINIICGLTADGKLPATVQQTGGSQLIATRSCDQMEEEDHVSGLAAEKNERPNLKRRHEEDDASVDLTKTKRLQERSPTPITEVTPVVSALGSPSPDSSLVTRSTEAVVVSRDVNQSATDAERGIVAICPRKTADECSPTPVAPLSAELVVQVGAEPVVLSNEADQSPTDAERVSSQSCRTAVVSAVVAPGEEMCCADSVSSGNLTVPVVPEPVADRPRSPSFSKEVLDQSDEFLLPSEASVVVGSGDMVTPHGATGEDSIWDVVYSSQSRSEANGTRQTEVASEPIAEENSLVEVEAEAVVSAVEAVATDDDVMVLDDILEVTATVSQPAVSKTMVVSESDSSEGIVLLDTSQLSPLKSRPKTVKCSWCSKMFWQEANCRRHEAFEHSQDVSNVCRLCEEDFGVPLHGVSHVCRGCCAAFEVKSQFDAHMDEHNKKGVYYSCDMCSGLQTSNPDLEAHKRHHLNRQLSYRCIHCTPHLMFTEEGQIMHHLKEVHSVPIYYFCKKCCLGSVNGELIWRHIVDGKCDQMGKRQVVSVANLGLTAASQLMYQPASLTQHKKTLKQRPLSFVTATDCAHRSFFQFGTGFTPCLEENSTNCYGLTNINRWRQDREDDQLPSCMMMPRHAPSCIDQLSMAVRDTQTLLTPPPSAPLPLYRSGMPTPVVGYASSDDDLIPASAAEMPRHSSRLTDRGRTRWSPLRWSPSPPRRQVRSIYDLPAPPNISSTVVTPARVTEGPASRARRAAETARVRAESPVATNTTTPFWSTARDEADMKTCAACRSTAMNTRFLVALPASEKLRRTALRHVLERQAGIAALCIRYGQMICSEETIYVCLRHINPSALVLGPQQLTLSPTEGCEKEGLFFEYFNEVKKILASPTSFSTLLETFMTQSRDRQSTYKSACGLIRLLLAENNCKTCSGDDIDCPLATNRDVELHKLHSSAASWLWSCRECAHSSIGETTAIQHVMTAHYADIRSVVYQLDCPFAGCQQSFSQTDGLHRHIMASHWTTAQQTRMEQQRHDQKHGPQNECCSLCCLAPSSHSSEQSQPVRPLRHELVHGLSRTTNCRICFAVLPTENVDSNLLQHCLKEHAELFVGRSTCSVCSDHIWDLGSHLARHHKVIMYRARTTEVRGEKVLLVKNGTEMALAYGQPLNQDVREL